jgi:hypothetical protein
VTSIRVKANKQKAKHESRGIRLLPTETSATRISNKNRETVSMGTLLSKTVALKQFNDNDTSFRKNPPHRVGQRLLTRRRQPMKAARLV